MKEHLCIVTVGSEVAGTGCWVEMLRAGSWVRVSGLAAEIPVLSMQDGASGPFWEIGVHGSGESAGAGFGQRIERFELEEQASGALSLMEAEGSTPTPRPLPSSGGSATHTSQVVPLARDGPNFFQNMNIFMANR